MRERKKKREKESVREIDVRQWRRVRGAFNKMPPLSFIPFSPQHPLRRALFNYLGFISPSFSFSLFSLSKSGEREKESSSRSTEACAERRSAETRSSIGREAHRQSSRGSVGEHQREEEGPREAAGGGRERESARDPRKKA